MKRTLSCSFALLCLCLLTACSTSDEPQPNEKPNETSRQEMKINLFLQEGDRLIPLNDLKSNTTRAAENTLESGFMLYGLYTNSDMPTATDGSLSESGSRRFFDKTSVDANGVYSGNTRYWVGDGITRHSFFAYSGKEYVSGSYGIQSVNGLGASPISYPSLTYYQPHDPKVQQDYLVAYGPTNLLVNQAAPEVNIRFRHACSRVIFKIMASGGVSYYKTQVNITYGANLAKDGGEVYFEPKAKSNGSSYFGGTYLLSEGLVVPSSANTEGKAVEAGELLLPPQAMASSGWVQVLVNYTLSEGSVLDPANIKKSNVPAINLEPDRQYTYYFKLAESSDNLTLYDVVVEPWTTENVIVDELD